MKSIFGRHLELTVAVLLWALAPWCPGQAQPAAPAGGGVDMYVDRQKGIRAMGDRIYSAAVRSFQSYRDATRQQEPAFADATILLVKAHLCLGQATEADAALTAHEQTSKGLTDNRYLEGLVYWRGAVFLRQGKYDAALAKAQPLATGAQTPEYKNLALEIQGDAYVRLRKWTEAEAVLNRLLTEFPGAENALRARLGLARVYLATQQTDRAAQVLGPVDQGAAAAGGPPMLSLCRVLLLLQQSKLDDALKLYQSVEGQRPQEANTDWWLVTSQLASALMLANRHEEALGILPQTTVLASSDDERMQTLLRTAEALIALERTELAINALETFRKTYPGTSEVVPVQLKLAELLRRGKKYMLACEYFGNIMNNE